MAAGELIERMSKITLQNASSMGITKIGPQNLGPHGSVLSKEVEKF